MNQKSLYLLPILVATFLVGLFQLSNAPIAIADEARFVELAREMLESGDFITPYLNYQAHFTQALLPYWLESLSLNIFGVNEFAARLPALLAALGMVALAFLLGEILEMGLLAAIIMATSFELLLFSKLATVDLLFAFFISAVICFFFLGYVNQDSYRRKFAFNKKVSSNWFISMFVMLACAVLTKGPLAIVLPLLVILSFLIWNKEFLRFALDARKELILGSLAFLFISLPWYFAVHYATEGAFSADFFSQQNPFGFFNSSNFSAAPIWLYVPVIFAATFPWSAFLIQSFLFAFSGSPLKMQSRLCAQSLVSFCVWCFSIIFIVLSLSAYKTVSLSLLLLLPTTIILANWWRDRFMFLRSKPLKNLDGLYGLIVQTLLFIVAVSLCMTAFKSQLELLSKDAFVLAILTVSFVLLCGFAVAMTAILRQAKMAFIFLAASVYISYFLLSALVYTPYMHYMDDSVSSFMAENPDAKIYSFAENNSAFFFYAKKDLEVISAKKLYKRLVAAKEDPNYQFYFIARPERVDVFRQQLREWQAEPAVDLFSLSKENGRFVFAKSY